MSAPRIGSLCTGYGGLDMAVEAVIPDAELAWVSDIDKGACKVLAHRYPDVPNLGDFTKINWTAVTPVEILTAGYPCQPFSHAGNRKGANDERHLWPAVREAIRGLRPRLTLLENVAGHRSLGFDRVLGDLAEDGMHVRWTSIRAADIGAPHGRERLFIVVTPDSQHPQLERVGQLPGLRGGPDSRPDVSRLLGTPTARNAPRSERFRSGRSLTPVELALLPTPAVNDMGEGKTVEAWDEWTAKMQAAHGNGNGHGKSLAIEAQRLLPTPTVQDVAASGGSTPSDVTLTDAVVRTNLGREENPRHASPTEGRPGEGLRDVRGATGPQEVRQWSARGQDGVPQAPALLPEVRKQPQGDPARQPQVEGSSDRAPADVPGVRGDQAPARPSHRPEPGEQPSGQPHHPLCLVPSETALAGGPRAACGCHTNWGDYEAAIRRWEWIIGRAAPSPTQLSTSGRPQLDARFSEFLMGLPAGWITDVPGITRNEALRLAGNGVVRQQAAAALRIMLGYGHVSQPEPRPTGALLGTPTARDGKGSGQGERLIESARRGQVEAQIRLMGGAS